METDTGEEKVKGGNWPSWEGGEGPPLWNEASEKDRRQNQVHIN